MTDFNKYLLQEGEHDSKKKLAQIFIIVSILFCFVYTIIFGLLGATLPALIQLIAGILFVFSYFLLKFKRAVNAKILAMVTSFFSETALFFLIDAHIFSLALR